MHNYFAGLIDKEVQKLSYRGSFFSLARNTPSGSEVARYGPEWLGSFERCRRRNPTTNTAATDQPATWFPVSATGVEMRFRHFFRHRRVCPHPRFCLFDGGPRPQRPRADCSARQQSKQRTTNTRAKASVVVLQPLAVVCCLLLFVVVVVLRAAAVFPLPQPHHKHTTAARKQPQAKQARSSAQTCLRETASHPERKRKSCASDQSAHRRSVPSAALTDRPIDRPSVRSPRSRSF